MEAKDQVLQAMREIGAPVNAGKIAEVTGLDRKVVDKAFDALKKEGAIVSPVRCKWEPAKLCENGSPLRYGGKPPQHHDDVLSECAE